jgi:glycosyltransferase involved in cell wall biosynthesis
MNAPRVAVVHDWFTVYTGSERVVEQILVLYPQADLFSLIDFVPPNQRGFLRGKAVYTSFIQKLPFARQKYRQYLPLMPLAIEQFDLTDYDIVLSSSHAVAKGVLTGQHQLHLSYIHSPLRYAWDMQHSYLAEHGYRKAKGMLARLILHYMRLWDLRTITSIDALAANSEYIKRKIKKLYGRTAEVIFPPVDTSRFAFCEEKLDYYLVVSRLVQYKRVDLIVNAFAGMPDRKLVVIGDGPDFKKIERLKTPNIQLLRYQPEAVTRKYMQEARAFVFTAQEDFGIAPVEAQACGTPVLAYNVGGARETIRGEESSEPTGIFFTEQSTEAVREAVERFERLQPGISPRACRENALRFDVQKFQTAYRDFVDRNWLQFKADLQ